jgi:hypothetical protein
LKTLYILKLRISFIFNAQFWLGYFSPGMAQ